MRKQQIRERLARVCAHLPAESFDELVEKICRTHDRDARRVARLGVEAFRPRETNTGQGTG